MNNKNRNKEISKWVVLPLIVIASYLGPILMLYGLKILNNLFYPTFNTTYGIFWDIAMNILPAITIVKSASNAPKYKNTIGLIILFLIFAYYLLNIYFNILDSDYHDVFIVSFSIIGSVIGYLWLKSEKIEKAEAR